MLDPKFLQARRRLEEMMRDGRSYSGNERNCCFLNTGAAPGADGRFATISAVSGFDFTDDARSLGIVDWDHDGDLDLWVTNRTGPQVRFLRNNLNQQGRFLAIRLEGDGKSVNRDAIGARVEVVLRGTGGKEQRARKDTEHPPLVRSVRAGEGFLGQSSKWLHFGLGDSATIDHVVVRWPGGKTERIVGLKPDKRYTIALGAGRAVDATLPARSIDLPPRTLVRERVSDVSRAFFVVRLPLPKLPITRLSKNSTTHDAGEWADRGAPTLIVLWASWCKPCLKELQELAQNLQRLQKAGVGVLALCVEGPGSQKPLGEDQVRDVLQRLDWNAEAGIANRETLDKLKLLNKTLFARPRPLPLPASFLVDANGHLAAIYRGPVQIEQLLKDVDDLEADPRSRLELAVGFSGRWQQYTVNSHYHYVAGFFQEAGFHDYATMLNQEAVRVDPQNATALLRLGRTQLDAGQYRLAVEYLQRVVNLRLHDPEINFETHENIAKAFHALGRFSLAQRHYEQALSLRASPVICNNLGLILASQQKMSQAADFFAKAARLDPSFDEAFNNYGVACVELKRPEQAVKAFRRALEINPDHARSHNNLGYQLEIQGKLREALRHYQRAVDIEPNFTSARKNLQQLESTPSGSPKAAVQNQP